MGSPKGLRYFIPNTLETPGSDVAPDLRMIEQPSKPDIHRPVDPIDKPPPDIKPVPPPDIPPPAGPPDIHPPSVPERGGDGLIA